MWGRAAGFGEFQWVKQKLVQQENIRKTEPKKKNSKKIDWSKFPFLRKDGTALSPIEYADPIENENRIFALAFFFFFLLLIMWDENLFSHNITTIYFFIFFEIFKYL